MQRQAEGALICLSGNGAVERRLEVLSQPSSAKPVCRGAVRPSAGRAGRSWRWRRSKRRAPSHQLVAKVDQHAVGGDGQGAILATGIEERR